MTNIIVLGVSGMLGSMVFNYLSKNEQFKVFGTSREPSSLIYKNILNLDAKNITEEALLKLITKSKPDYIVNCIGIINKYCTPDNQEGIQNAILVNALFPYKLAYVTKKFSPKTKIIQIATDCVYSGNKGNYIENDIHDPVDVYGKSKSLGEVVNDNFINIRCSIIGPELKTKISLLEWFLAKSEHETVYGYNHHIWNGVTTLQFAQFCEEVIIENKFDTLRSLNHVIHYCKNESVSKYELLLIFKEVFRKDVEIIKIDNSKRLNRTLDSIYLKNEMKKISDSVFELNEFVLKTNYYN
jgi:dTDP-4-dehydrorhamnose reductase